MATYKPLQSVSVSTATSSITFSGIDQNYTDLIVISSIKVTAGTPVVQVLINSDTNSNYSRTGLYGDPGGTAVGYKETSISSLKTFSADSTNFTPMTLHFSNYSNTTTNKSILTRSGITYPTLQAGLYRSTAAITSLTINLSSSTFEPGTTFDLYGIKSGAPQALGGDVVTTDGNFWYHTFRTTQTFTPLRNLTCDYLVVAGGGGGGNIAGGGGGAGGLRSTVTATGGGGALESAISVTAQAYTIQVGAGGATAQYSPAISGTNGTNSIFSTITSIGGGYGGFDTAGVSGTNGANGGSGGGGRGQGATTTGGNGTANQGFNGAGQSIGAPNYPGAGGGGAGAAGGGVTSTTAGNGGNGVAVSITGSSVTYAGGGGGGIYYTNTAGTGGTGGGGNGASNGGVGSNGTANLGGGGGGGGSNGSNLPNGGNGGSGIVIVRYPV